MDMPAAPVAFEAKKYYLRTHDSESATTIATVVLFDALIKDLEDGSEEPVTFLSRAELAKKVKEHSVWKERHHAKRIEDFADLVAAQIKPFVKKRIRIDGRVWVVSVW